MGKQFFSFLPSFLHVIILGFLFCFLFRSVPISLLRRSVCASKVVEWECKTRRKGGGKTPATADGFCFLAFSHSRILALYRCYEMWVWSGGMEVLVTEGIAYDMA